MGRVAGGARYRRVTQCIVLTNRIAVRIRRCKLCVRAPKNDDSTVRHEPEQAGVYGKGISRKAVMRVNADALIRVTEALLAAVQRGNEKTILLITSQLGARRGSRGDLGDYGESKAC